MHPVVRLDGHHELVAGEIFALEDRPDAADWEAGYRVLLLLGLEVSERVLGDDEEAVLPVFPLGPLLIAVPVPRGS